jgi:hypothetical protein
MKHASRSLRRLGGALGSALLLVLLTAGCGDDASDSDVPDAAERDAAPTIDARGPVDAARADADPGTSDGGFETCGGFTGKQCEGKTYCDFPENNCGESDASGECKPRPDACPPVLTPVCGCDGMDYTNECEAHLAGTDIASEGNCPR